MSRERVVDEMKSARVKELGRLTDLPGGEIFVGGYWCFNAFSYFSGMSLNGDSNVARKFRENLCSMRISLQP